jgi:triosephosphate isomerase
MSAPVPLIAGNWKMNGLGASLAEAEAVAAGLDGVTARVAICPPSTLLDRMAKALAGSKVLIGGQDCRAEESGAFTGDISARMLVDAGAGMVILGHSERRTGYGESAPVVARKVEAALRAGLEPIICVGETLEERRSRITLEVVTAQIRGSMPAMLAEKTFTVAYEPVWAIGTGLTPTLAEIEETHRAIRNVIVKMFGAAKGASVPILYGGSVNPKNAAEILHTPEVGGALVGGASLKAADFLQIVRAV